VIIYYTEPKITDVDSALSSILEPVEETTEEVIDEFQETEEISAEAEVADEVEEVRNVFRESGALDYARKMIKVGYPAGFSTAWISWIHIENFGAWHNVPIGTKANGFEGLDTEFVFNEPLHVKHIQQLADWQKENVFIYGGRRNLGNAKFSSGEVAMYTESSAGYAGFKKTCEFAIVVSDKWQGKGIARLLMQKLIDIARNRSLEVMEGQVLANNYRMLELMKSLKFKIETDPEDSAIKRVVAQLHTSG